MACGIHSPGILHATRKGSRGTDTRAPLITEARLLSYLMNSSTAFSFSSLEYISYLKIAMIRDRFSSASPFVHCLLDIKHPRINAMSRELV